MYRYVLGIFFLMVFFVACAGGGTSGTGIKNFSGTARTTAGIPASGVSVIVTQTGASDTSDEQGQFSLATEIGSGDVELSFAKDSANASLVIPSLPEGDVSVTLAVEVDEQEQTVKPSVVDIVSDDNGGSDSSSSSSGDNSSSSSSGSGDARLAFFRGILLSATGEPLVGVTITSPELGITVTTDEFGNFSVEGLPVNGNVTFVVSGDNFDDTVTVGSVSGGSTIDLTLELDEGLNQVSATVTGVSSSSSGSSSGSSSSSGGNSSSSGGSSSSSSGSSSSSSSSGSSSSSSSTSDPDDIENSSSSSSSGSGSSSGSSSGGGSSSSSAEEE